MAACKAVAGSWVRGGGWLHVRTAALLADGLVVDGCCTDVQLRCWPARS